MVNWFIMAAGHANRCNGEIKQLYEINGEPIIRRTIRLIRAVDPAPSIYVVSWRSELRFDDTKFIDTGTTTRCLNESMLYTVPYWGQANCIIMSDVIFTEEVIRTVYEHSHITLAYGRYEDDKHGNPERYALTFGSWSDLDSIQQGMRFCMSHTLRNDVPCCITRSLWMPVLKVLHVITRPLHGWHDVVNQMYIRTPLARYIARCAPMYEIQDYRVRDVDTYEELQMMQAMWD